MGGSSIQCTDFKGGGGHDTVLRMGGGGIYYSAQL